MSTPIISGFTFIRDGVKLGFPFVESILSVLPLVDEFVVAVGRSNDGTLERVRAIGDPRIRVIETIWNEQMIDRGFVYAQQKMIAQYACTGQWAFYLEGDEIVHEAEISAIRDSLQRHHGNPAVEALVFDYFHFYGTPEFLANSPRWYRRECRLIRNTIRSYAPDGQYWLITHDHKRPRYPNAALANAHIYHYGWARKTKYMQAKLDRVTKYWAGHLVPSIDYGDTDPGAIVPFSGKHPIVMEKWIANEAEHELMFNAGYRLTRREKKHRISLGLEKLTGLELSRKHYKIVA